MNLLKTLLISGITIVLVQSCKDDPEKPPVNNNPSNKTKQELLSQKNWKVSNLVTSGTDIWGTGFVEACNKDNEYRFRTDDSLVLYDKANKCNGSDPDSTISSYKLFNNNTQLILNVKLTGTITINDTADVIELSESLLKVDAEYSGIPATISFQHP